MRRALSLLALPTLACAHAAGGGGSGAELPVIETRRDAIVETLHGVEVADPYRWLEDAESTEVKAWMAAHDARARAHLSGLPGRDALSARLSALHYVDELTVPVTRGDRSFFTRRAPDVEKPILFVRDGTGAPRPLVDPNTLTEGGDPVSLGVYVPSPDGRRLAFALRPNNADEATLYVMDVDTGARSEVDVIPGAKYAEPSWLPDGRGFVYVWLPTDASIPVDERPGRAEVRYHALGTGPEADVVVHAALRDPTKFVDGRVSHDGAWILFTVWSGWAHNDVWLRPLPKEGPGADWDPAAGWQPFAVDTGSISLVEPHEGTFYVATNQGAPRWQLFAAAPGAPRAEWRLIIAEDAEATIEGFSVVGGRLALSVLVKAANQIRIHALDGKLERTVALPTLGSTSGLLGQRDRPEAYFSFSSFTHPPAVYRVDVGADGAPEPFLSEAMPAPLEGLEVRQEWFTSKDGTRVSMFVVAKAGLPRDGTAPALMFGYGGFSVSLTPWFKALWIPWVEAGGVYAMPNLRGGGEYGEAWHRAGMLEQKQNVFDDFAAATEFLASSGIAARDRIAIYGRSNGGLLVGAAMTQRPELFAAVVCGVPLIDMVRYHRFGSGRTWIAEYGSADDAEGFRVLHAYSPQHHVSSEAVYPPLLMLSTDHDDRVDPLHARKFVAAISAAKTRGPVLLRIEANAGHGGAGARKAEVAKEVDLLSFVMATLGVR